MTQNAIPAKVHFSDTDPELIAGLFGLLESKIIAKYTDFYV